MVIGVSRRKRLAPQILRTAEDAGVFGCVLLVRWLLRTGKGGGDCVHFYCFFEGANPQTPRASNKGRIRAQIDVRWAGTEGDVLDRALSSI